MGIPALSVIVPFLDMGSRLTGCIDSLLDQTLPRDTYELIFIDNNSTDDGPATVAARSEVRLLSEPTPGVYAARNRGVSAARGEILAFTDPDCQPERDWLERIAATMCAPEIGVVLGHRVPAARGGLMALVMAYESQKETYVTSSGIGEHVFGHANNMAVRREVMERVGPFPEVVRGGDTVLVRRAVDSYGCRVVRYEPKARVRHLEVARLRDYYRKTWTYGQSNERLRELVPFRPLSIPERWRVFRRTVQEQGWSPGRGALLLALLIPGLVSYEWGRHMSVKQRGGDEHPTGPGDLRRGVRAHLRREVHPPSPLQAEDRLRDRDPETVTREARVLAGRGVRDGVLPQPVSGGPARGAGSLSGHARHRPAGEPGCALPPRRQLR